MATAVQSFPSTMTPMRRENAEAQKDTRSLKEYLDYVDKKFMDVGKPSRIARFYTWSKVEMFWRGQQLWWLNPESGRFEPMDEEDIDLYFINNIMLPFIEQISAEYAKSKPKLIAYSEAGDDRHILDAVDAAQYLIDCWVDSLWTLEDLQRESKIVQFRTACFTRTYWDETAGPMIEVPQFGDMQGMLGDMPHQYSGVTGQQRIRMGCIRSDAVDPLEVEVWDRARTVRESPYLIWDRAEYNNRLLRRYPHLSKLPKASTDKSSLFQSGLAFKRQLELLSGATGEFDANTASGYGGTSYGGDSEICDDITSRHTESWYDVEVYGDYVTKPEDRLPGTDEELPVGVKLGELFAEGCKVARINGEIVSVLPAAKNDEWDCYKYMVPAAGFYGVGSENLMSQQEGFNEGCSILTAGLLYGSNGILVANTQKVKDGTVVNKPGAVIGVEDMYPDESLDNVIKHITTQGLDPVAMQMPTFYKESMQFTSGARSTQVSGVPGQGIKTATGVMEMKSTMDSFSGMRLELRGENLARRMEQALKIWQKRQVYPRYYAGFGESKGRMLRSFDIPVEIRVRMEEDSAGPRTLMDKRQDAGMAMSMGVGTGQLPPATDAYLGRLFNQPSELNRRDDWETLGQQRLDAMDQAEQESTQLMQTLGVQEEMAAPFLVQEMVAVAMPDELDDHEAIIDFYLKHYLSDKYRESSEVHKAAIHEVINMHKAGIVMQAQEMTGMQVAAQGPAIEAERGMQMEDEERQAGREQEGKAAEEGAKAEEREHQSGEAERSREHEMMMEGMRGEQQMAVERERGKNKGEKK